MYLYEYIIPWHLPTWCVSIGLFQQVELTLSVLPCFFSPGNTSSKQFLINLGSWIFDGFLMDFKASPILRSWRCRLRIAPPRSSAWRANPPSAGRDRSTQRSRRGHPPAVAKPWGIGPQCLWPLNYESLMDLMGLMGKIRGFALFSKPWDGAVDTLTTLMMRFLKKTGCWMDSLQFRGFSRHCKIRITPLKF